MRDVTIHTLVPMLTLLVALAGCTPGGSLVIDDDDAGDDDAGDDDAGDDDSGDGDGSYVILTNLGSGDAYYDAVALLRDHRDALVLDFDPAAPEAVIPELVAHDTRYAAIVLKPEDLDVNVARRFLMASTTLDDDPFSDVSYGYITGASAADATAFVEGIIRAETEDDIASKPLSTGGWVASTLNQVYQSSYGSYFDYLEVERYADIYLAEDDPGTLAFFEQNVSQLQDMKLLEVGHNGDPHMLWLFGDGNMAPDIWDYDPALVESPPVERMGLSSDHVRDLDLYPAVAINGACHSGVLKQALVEADIQATFGDTGGLYRFYEMSDEFSFALAMLQTGITGYFAPIGSNNANEAGEEYFNILRYNEPLGDIHKRVIDGMVMAFEGHRPQVCTFTDGEPTHDYETEPSGSYDPQAYGLGSAIMLSGRANRVYYGDPLYQPFVDDGDPRLQLTTTEVSEIGEGEIEIALIFDKPDLYFPVWEKFHTSAVRSYTTVELPEAFADGVQVELLGTSGADEYFFWALEQHAGRTILHLEFDLDEDMYAAVLFTAQLAVTAS